MPSALRASAIREREVVRSHASYITSCAFAVASSPRRPAIAARKLSIARLSGNAAGALAFVEVLRAAFERGFFDIGIFVCPPSYGPTIRCWATIRDTVGWLMLQRRAISARYCRAVLERLAI